MGCIFWPIRVFLRISSGSNPGWGFSKFSCFFQVLNVSVVFPGLRGSVLFAKLAGSQLQKRCHMSGP